MAHLVCVADGNFTAAATWATVDSTFLMPTAGATSVSTSDLASANFQPGAITIDAIYLKLNSVGTSPAASSTLTVTLYNATDAGNVVSLAYNTAELPANGIGAHGGWICFKLDNSYLLVAGKNYNIKLKVAATASQPSISFHTNGTANNWAHMLRIPGTTAAPAAADQMHISGELAPAATWTNRTVTMDETAATDYGTNANLNLYDGGGIDIGKNGTLTWGTTASTAYNLRLSGSLVIYDGGTMNMGTVATPCPRNSSMLLEFDTAASKNYSLYVYTNGTLVMQGQSRTSAKNVWRSLLTSTAASGQTTVNVTDDTGWLSGDIVTLTPTDGVAHAENITLNGDAGASSLTATGNLTNAHTVADHKWAYAVLLTRNVIVRSLNTTNDGGIFAYGAIDLDWVWIDYGWIGFFNTLEKSVDYCSFRGTGNSSSGCFYTANGSLADNVRIRNCFLDVEPHSPGLYFDNESTSDYTLTNNIIVGHNTSATGFTYNGQWGADTSISGIQCYGFSGSAGILELANPNGNYIEGTSVMPSDMKAMWCTYGWRLHATYYPVCGATFTGFTAVEGAGTAFVINPASNAGGFFNCDFVDFTSINQGNTTSSGFSLEGNIIDCRFINPIAKTNATKNGSYAMSLGTPSSNQVVGYIFEVLGGVLSSGTSPYQDNASGIFTYNGASSAAFFNIKFRGTNMGGVAAIFASASNAKTDKKSRYSRDGSGDDVHELNYILRGTIAYETTTYRTTSPSAKMSPVGNTLKLEGIIRHVPVVDGAAAKTITCYMRKNGSYNGNAPRLMLKRNDQLGVTSETVIATSNLVAQDTWYSVSGALPVATDDGIYEVYVDCDGTAGSIFVDDWSIT